MTEDFITGLVTPKGWTKIRSPQYKLYEFIETHFSGNISAAAKKIKMSKFHLIQIVNFGIFGSKTANRIVVGLKQVDPDASFDTLFIRPKYKRIEKKKKVEYPKAIPPQIGSVKSCGTGLFSGMLARHR